jgi:hypothetical protein
MLPAALALMLAIAMLPATLAAEPAPRGLPALKAGQTLESALEQLIAQGHQISYSTVNVQPDMRLLSHPEATTIEALLPEILAPWGLSARPAPRGGWLIVADTQKRPELPTSAPVAVLPLEEIDVIASRYGLIDSVGQPGHFLDRSEVQHLPHLTDDAIRILKSLPGVAGGDISAQFNLRGGRRDESLLMIDGLELYDPFHLKDLDGALSIVDTNLVEHMQLLSGGFTAAYGDRMSGVVDIVTRTPAPDDELRSAVGVSFINAFVRTQNVFADDKGFWSVSARRGYLDLAVELVQEDDEEFTPRYQDVLAKVGYRFNDRTSLVVQTLLGTDELTYVETSGESTESGGNAESGYLWATLEHAFSDRLSSLFVLSAGTIERARDVINDDPGILFADVEAHNDFEFVGLRQDWQWQIAPDHLLLFGTDFRDYRADYDYRRVSALLDPIITGGPPIDTSTAVVMDADGNRLNGYAAYRFRVADRVTTEIGVRAARYRYPDIGDQSSTDPRVNLALSLGPDTDLRASWGQFSQGQGLDELQVEDGVSQFFPPEHAEHRVLSLQHGFGAGWSFRVEAYEKRYSDLRPRFENVFDPLELITEAQPDRIRIDADAARARGVELLLKRAPGQRWSGWLSYAYSEADDDDAGEWVPRSWDQRHAASWGINYAGTNWNWTLTGLYHTGWPTTALTASLVQQPDGSFRIVPEPGPRNGERLGDFHRIDIRGSRVVQLQNGRLSFFLEVYNLLNRDNPCCIDEFDLFVDAGGSVTVTPNVDYWLPIIPSFGIQYEF